MSIVMVSLLSFWVCDRIMVMNEYHMMAIVDAEEAMRNC